MLRHSFVPSQFRSSWIVPIIKSKRGSLSDVNNYRGIAVSSVVSKVLELVLLKRLAYSDALHTSELQFGFKKSHSCKSAFLIIAAIVPVAVVVVLILLLVLLAITISFRRCLQDNCCSWCFSCYDDCCPGDNPKTDGNDIRLK
eukprot:m.226450 g.226450  ORF g.226450 m.226450 type:complete len:143 (+) comp40026_c1_seq13:1044-1472(+)